MEELIVSYLENLKRDITQKQVEVKQLVKDPLYFFSHVVWGRNGIIPMVVGERSEEELLAYQNWLYPALIEELASKLNTEDLLLHYIEESFPSPIFISYNDQYVAEIRPYDHTIVFLLPDNVRSILEEMTQTKRVISELENELKLREIEEANPLILGGSNPMTLLKISTRKKKVQGEIKEKAVRQLDELSKSRLDYAMLEEELKIVQSENLFAEDKLERIARRLKEYYQFDTLNEKEQYFDWMDSEIQQLEEQKAQELEEVERTIRK